MEEHILIVMDRSIHEEQLSQPLQTNNKQIKTAVTFLTGYNGIFEVTNRNIIFFSQNHLLTKMVLCKLPYHLVLTKPKV